MWLPTRDADADARGSELAIWISFKSRCTTIHVLVGSRERCCDAFSKLGNNLGTNVPDSGLKPWYRTKDQSKRTNKTALRVLPGTRGRRRVPEVQTQPFSTARSLAS